jgi:nitroimidazol reductase NimA-like FMN-containing flavoprotein (pyridoxamine 5'-phosphate oxidase superfamily)
MTADAQSLLNQHAVLCVATTRPDGWPQATMVCYVNEGLVVYFLVSRSSQKFANLARDPRASLAIGQDAAEPAQIKGLSMAAEVLEVRDEPYRSRVLARLNGRHPKYFSATDVDPAGSALMRALPRVISVVDFSKGLGHTDLLSVGAGQLAEDTAATPDNWGFNPAPDGRAPPAR